MRKSTRTISGVTPVAVMTVPLRCPGRCVYCPSYAETPRSYTPKSPAVLRAIECEYDVRRQVESRLKILADMGHPVDKVELIVMGGTFLAQDEEYQYRFIEDCFDALNGVTSETLEEAQSLNEQSARRCVGLCIETRPDWCGEKEIARMLRFGTTRVELGVQMLDDEIYRLVKRGHSVAEVVTATRLLKESGLKVHYHWMPGLPGATPENDLKLSAQLFSDSRFRPDGLKIYPTMVVAGTELERWAQEGRYQPYDNETMIDLICHIKALVPPYVRISRVLRDIPAEYIVGGLKDSLREQVRQRMQAQGATCQCIRCREYGHRLREKVPVGAPQLVRRDYDASEGKEIFLSFEDDNATLFGLLRLRIQVKSVTGSGDVGSAQAIVRELHVYGTELAFSQHDPGAAQHRGIGRALLAAAEQLARNEFHAGTIAVLSGVGARDYYRDLGYTRQGSYMVKALPQAVNLTSPAPAQ